MHLSKNLVSCSMFLLLLFTAVIAFGPPELEAKPRDIVIAQANPVEDPVTPIMVIQYLAPLAVLGATWLIRLVKPSLSGWVIVYLIVPALSALLAWLATLVLQDVSFLTQVAYGLGSIILMELLKQLKQGNDNSPSFQSRVAKAAEN